MLGLSVSMPKLLDLARLMTHNEAARPLNLDAKTPQLDEAINTAYMLGLPNSTPKLLDLARLTTHNEAARPLGLDAKVS